jgi:histidinol-phosphatase (PHP family)
MTLPADTHVHSEFSWDTGGPTSAAAGRMRATCARAVAIGLPAVVFTEHLDFDSAWRTEPQDLMPNHADLRGPDGHMTLPALDVVGYLDAIERCRHEFPELHILTGVEFGQPHLHEAAAAQLLDLGAIDRINGSLHTLRVGDDRYEPAGLYRLWPAERVMREYLLEIPRMVAGSDVFEVFTHIDYAVRAWPIETEGPFDPRRFEEEFRAAMRAIAGSGRALEMNTRRLWSWVPQWWSEEGGRAISFGSDSHVPEALAGNFPEAMVMVEHFGFRPGSRPEDFWTR